MAEGEFQPRVDKGQGRRGREEQIPLPEGNSRENSGNGVWGWLKNPQTPTVFPGSQRIFHGFAPGFAFST